MSDTRNDLKRVLVATGVVTQAHPKRLDFEREFALVTVKDCNRSFYLSHETGPRAIGADNEHPTFKDRILDGFVAREDEIELVVDGDGKTVTHWGLHCDWVAAKHQIAERQRMENVMARGVRFAIRFTRSSATALVTLGRNGQRRVALRLNPRLITCVF